MIINLIVKAGMIWFVIAVFAVINGAFRESVLVPSFGQSVALPISGLNLSIIIFMVTYLSFALFRVKSHRSYLFIGIQWVLMTLIFEFVFGHYVAGKSWADILQIFNILKGNLFIVVLLVSFISPLLVAKIKGAI